jgi:hypothetical protein
MSSTICKAKSKYDAGEEKNALIKTNFWACRSAQPWKGTASAVPAESNKYEGFSPCAWSLGFIARL